jgi:uncharacterized protein
MRLTNDSFRNQVRANPYNVAIFERLPALGLPQCYLTAGCLFQSVWNLASNQSPEWGIKDYDIFYFDDQDLSWEAENSQIERASKLFADLPITVELKNQARVHLWYEQRFGAPYPQLRSSQDGIDRYLVACTCVGIEVETGAVYAPEGYSDLAEGILKMNSRNPQPEAFESKARHYQSRWDWLTIVSP